MDCGLRGSGASERERVPGEAVSQQLGPGPREQKRKKGPAVRGYGGRGLEQGIKRTLKAPLPLPVACVKACEKSEPSWNIPVGCPAQGESGDPEGSNVRPEFLPGAGARGQE